MATLNKTKEDLQSYVSTAFNFTFEVVKPYVKRAEREYIKNLIGDTLYDAWSTTAPTDDDNVTKVYQLFREASANLAINLYVPVGSVNISDAGIMTISNQTTKPAEWWQVRDLRRSLINLGFSAIDEALKIMEQNPSEFSDWNDTEGYTIFKELITTKTQDFQRHFNISNSRLTFIALRPYLLETQNQIFNWLDADTLELIKSGTSAQAKQARDYAQAAQVNFTVAKAAQSGMFNLTATGLYFKSDVLPGSGNTGNYTKLTEAEIARLVETRTTAAEEYLKTLKTYLLANPSVFDTFEESTVDTSIFVHNTKSIVAF